MADVAVTAARLAVARAAKAGNAAAERAARAELAAARLNRDLRDLADAGITLAPRQLEPLHAALDRLGPSTRLET